jgi:hypothetical protein
MDRIQVRNISRFMGDERLTIGRRTGLLPGCLKALDGNKRDPDKGGV